MTLVIPLLYTNHLCSAEHFIDLFIFHICFFPVLTTLALILIDSKFSSKLITSLTFSIGIYPSGVRTNVPFGIQLGHSWRVDSVLLNTFETCLIIPSILYSL